MTCHHMGICLIMCRDGIFPSGDKHCYMAFKHTVTAEIECSCLALKSNVHALFQDLTFLVSVLF